jgi:hypothetical protein
MIPLPFKDLELLLEKQKETAKQSGIKKLAVTYIVVAFAIIALAVIFA